ncbi:MAG: bifunctional pyr operon transcriptional regulator/uracil phosphoribosyltransferase PyrR [Thermosipho sp. (in: Bacteria)]|nr:bifunctional pyr operon transcriptional regulator/uracil phosphoribosyltransferase PyrR [Thermosipho sp. (in: thermotogales)]
MKKILEADDIKRSLIRISHEILEKNKGTENLVIIGILTRGYYIAKRIVENIEFFEGVKVPLGKLDVSPFRDDEKRKTEDNSEINFDLNNKNVVLVDDVLFTGRTVRAAMDAITSRGRPSILRLAVLIDRGHREFPIRPDFVGKNIPTSKKFESVKVKLKEIDGEDAVYIVKIKKEE